MFSNKQNTVYTKKHKKHITNNKYSLIYTTISKSNNYKNVINIVDLWLLRFIFINFDLHYLNVKKR